MDIFFAAKTHKINIPFQAIATKKDNWQQCVSTYLHKHLQSLNIIDPFLVQNSKDLVYFLVNSNPGDCNIFSVDVEDLYYGIPYDALMESVKCCITEGNNELAFTSRSDVCAFLKIISYYLASICVEWKGNLYQL